jgi:prepilin-type N-terminal cleavage/methylation domain-containing protein
MSLDEQKNKLNTHCQSGLSLIDLMVTIAIIGILAAIALPSFNDVIQQNRMRLVVDTVVGDFRQAESLAHAAGAGQSVVLEISNPGASWSYSLSHSNSGSVLTRRASDFSGAISISVTGSDFSDADSDGNRDVTFNQLKRIDSAGAGRLVIALNDIIVEVARNLVGMMSVCSDNSSMGYSPCGN